MTVVPRPDGTRERVSPPISTEAEPFWDATRERTLLVQWCPACDRGIHFPRAACPTCLGDVLEHRPSTGEGVVYACSTMASPGNPTMSGREPYVVALVDLDEGIRMLTNIVGEDAAAVAPGDPVRVAWEPLEDARHLPVFVRIKA
ncbi:MAG: OB-fold domain-containing protein [Acidimicrobiales bacterium]|nr:OB-fold domain-containing protein [Acidimicrobiales bacterium]